MKRLIAYMTKYGSTEEYAKILSKELKTDINEADSAKDLKKYDQIIAMSGIYAGKMPIINFIKKNWKELKEKELILIIVGLLPVNHWWSKASYFLIPGFIKKKAKYFKIMGRDPKSKERVNPDNLKEVLKNLKK
jgi:menaquinone-dependent protoporphyrinogen IX oxidase